MKNAVLVPAVILLALGFSACGKKPEGNFTYLIRPRRFAGQ
ncbi:MAG: hypothetical protein NTY10_02300 [Candidatus Omnitrophica bacterium]|nr:hypothetical protein [Candidatus Omnitrophota bacterium]